jgi:hypothetical protein
MAGLDSSAIFLVVLPFILYVGYSELTRKRRRTEEKTDKHRRELKAEADDKLTKAYGPLLYWLEVAKDEPAREECRQKLKYVLTIGEISQIGLTLAANRHLIAEEIFGYWEKRFLNSQFVQWNDAKGSGGPVVLITGYACDLGSMWQKTKSDYDALMKQYQDNRS